MLLVLNLYVPANKGRLLIKISTFEMKLLDDNGINNYERIINLYGHNVSMDICQISHC